MDESTLPIYRNATETLMDCLTALKTGKAIAHSYRLGCNPQGNPVVEWFHGCCALGTHTSMSALEMQRTWTDVNQG